MKTSPAKLAYQNKYYEDNREDRLAYSAAHKEEKAANYAAHREEVAAHYAEVIKPRLEDRRAFLDKAKAGVGCADCGSTSGLHFHHRDKTTKKYNIADMLRMQWCEIMTEIWKCDVLCNSCHGKRHGVEDGCLVG